MKTPLIAFLAALGTAGCVVVPAAPAYYGPPRAYVYPPPPLVVPARPYYGPGYWSPRYRRYY